MSMQIQQSGKVTPGHSAIFVTDGVVQDGGPIAAAQKVIATLLSADFNSTFDQPLLIPPAITVFKLNSIIVANASVSLTTAVGGFYPAALKGGSPLVSGGTNYNTLTSPNLLVLPTLTGFASTARFSASNLAPLAGDTSGSLAIYFSLTTPQGVVATADIYVTAIDLTP